ncbi:MAG TPA: ATP-binding protein [Gemmatimonadales bacterium]|nr:ATP-binding protein [Gemmatimonadales bacterium]
MSFAGRLVVGTFMIVVVALLVLIIGSERTLRTSLERDLSLALEREARLVGSMLPRDTTRWQAVVDRVALDYGHRIVVRNPEGSVLAASDSLLGNRVMRAEISATGLTVITAAPMESIDDDVRRARRSMILASLTALFVALGVALLAGRSIARPLVELSSAARAIASGSQPRFPRSNIPEVDSLAAALRQMHGNLTDRFAELQRERAASAAMVDAMTDGILAADTRGRVVLINSAARRLLGYGPDDQVPPLQALFRVKEAQEAVGTAISGTPVRDQEVPMDGRILSISVVPAGNAGTVAVLRDLSEVRRLEAVRRDFVANVSHELKTPLTSISGYAETLLADDIGKPDRERFTRTILDNAHRMQTLVDDLLDLSRVESGRWSPSVAELDIDHQITAAWSGFADRAAAGLVTLHRRLAPDALMLRADPEAIRHILDNLLDNALRYVGRAGNITIASRRGEDFIELTVQDDGAGIPSEHLPRIFERFYRVDPSRSREDGGTGLGLSIVRHMVESHGGQVSATSQLRHGTTIICRFPL